MSDVGEELIGVAGRADDEINIISSTYRTMLCGNCKKKIHCVAGYKKGKEAPELLKDRCNKKDCECRCRRYYVGRDGRLRKYGKVDTSNFDDQGDGKRTTTDDLIDKLNKKNNKEKEENVPVS